MLAFSIWPSRFPGGATGDLHHPYSLFELSKKLRMWRTGISGFG